MVIDGFPDLVRQYAARHGLTKTALATLAGLHENTLRDLDKPNWSPSWKTATALSRLLQADTDEAA